MAKIIHLEIRNYRGVENLSLKFTKNRDLVCLIGRGDSGKTTILDAISSALSPSWNLNFYDTDFYNCDHSKNIEILVSLIDIPKSFLSEYKFGLYVRSLNIENDEIIDDVTLDEMNDDSIPVLTIKLTVDNSLEPKWVVTNTREHEDKPISGTDRGHLNCFMISDYVDRHFSWNKGNPLYALLKSTESDGKTDDNNIIIQHLRRAKKEIDKNDFESLNTATALIKSQATELGLDISEISTTLDSRELSIRDGRISLHEDSVPFRQKGKGSKRLASIAIQFVLVRNGGIMLIDELEQGLEPDRVKQAVRSLKEHHAGQIFITTHSRDAITELGSEPLLFMLKNKQTSEIEARPFVLSTEDLQKTIRACPEAFFAKKVIICEGATEIGICRAMDKWRRTNGYPQMSFKDCAYVDGTGNTLAQRVSEINDAGIKTALFCDSDVTKINEKKSQWKTNGVSIFDCEDTFCLEQQIFKDLPWVAITKLIDYVVSNHKRGSTEAVKSSISTKYSSSSNTFPDNWINTDTLEMRNAMASASVVKEKEWFKALHHGEFLGDTIFDHIDTLDQNSHLRKMFTELSNWIDE